MATFAIYKYLFDCSRSNLRSLEDGQTPYEKAQMLLEQILTEKLPITRERRDHTVALLENDVARRSEGVTVLVVCNEKNINYKEKLEPHTLETHPGCYVIVDNRPGMAQMAIERSASFSKTDRVRDLLQEALNERLGPYGLSIDIRPKWIEGEFWKFVDERKNVYHDTISRVAFHFPSNDATGPLDTSRQMVERLAAMRALAASINGVKGCFLTEAAKGDTLHLDRTHEDLAQMVALCSQNGYDISVKFRHLGIYRFGEQVQALYTLKDNVMTAFVHDILMSQDEESLLMWLDRVKRSTEKPADETTAEQE